MPLTDPYTKEAKSTRVRQRPLNTNFNFGNKKIDHELPRHYSGFFLRFFSRNFSFNILFTFYHPYSLLFSLPPTVVVENTYKKINEEHSNIS